jgi:hypothetical protein
MDSGDVHVWYLLKQVVKTSGDGGCAEPVVLQNGFTGSDLGFVGWLTGGAVLVDEASDGVVALDPGWDQGDDGGVVVGGELVAALVGPVVVEVVCLSAEDPLGVTAVEK